MTEHRRLVNVGKSTVLEISMSRLAEFRKLEQQLAAQLAELETMRNDSALKEEVEFESRFRGLLGEYGFSLREIVGILDPQAGIGPKAAHVGVEKKPVRLAE